MSVVLDILGSIVVGSLLLLMLISFQFKMQDTTDRNLYMKDMIDHTDRAAVKLNKVIALAGIGFTPAETVTYATPDSFVFRSYWDYQTDTMSFSPVTISVKLATLPSPVGRTLTIRQNGVPLNDLGYIFWVEGLKFKYYDKYDVVTTNKVNVRSTELKLTFARSTPSSESASLQNKIQVRCFLMNTYMRGA